MTCESLTKIIKKHPNSLKGLLLDRSRRGEAAGPNESSRGLGLARLLTSPQLLGKTVNLGKTAQELEARRKVTVLEHPGITIFGDFGDF